jgi:hypothetical protein
MNNSKRIPLVVVFAVAGLLAISGCSKSDDKKVTVKSPSGNVAVETKPDGSITITDSKGGGRITGNTGVTPADLTVKPYPNAKVDPSAGNMKVDMPEGSIVNLVFSTPDKAEKVFAFYSAEVKDATSMKANTGMTVVGKTAAGKNVTIAITEKDNATQIYIQEMTEKKK